MSKTELGRWLGKAYTPVASEKRPGFRAQLTIDGKNELIRILF